MLSVQTRDFFFETDFAGSVGIGRVVVGVGRGDSVREVDEADGRSLVIHRRYLVHRLPASLSNINKLDNRI